VRLLLIRHGQTDSNARQLLDTAVPGADLNDIGRGQARALVGKLERQPLDVIVVSDLVRAQQTAAPLAAARGLEPLVRSGVREIQAGDLEMAGDDESWDQYLSTLNRWAAGDSAARVPGGENGQDLLARFDTVVAEVGQEGRRSAAIVSHGAAIRAWTGARATNIDTDFAANTRLGNTAVIILEAGPGTGWAVQTWADTAPPKV